MALDSLYYFSKYVLGFRDMELQPHWELCRFLERYAHKDDCLVLLPRGTFKSSIISVAYPLWRWCRDRDLRFLLTSAELSNAKNFLGLIKDHIERNKTFIALFGDWSSRGKDTWHETAISLAGRVRFTAEASLTASSSEVTKVSQHYDMAICDDLQTDKNVASKEGIDKLENYLQLLLPILDPLGEPEDSEKRRGARMIVGTRWHFDDIYGRLIAAEQKRRRSGKPQALRMHIRKAHNRKKSWFYFPKRFSEGYLQELYETSNMSRYHYSCQYLNDPMPDEEAIFKLSRLGYFVYDEEVREGKRILGGKESELPPILNYFTTIDPSVGDSARSDYTAIVTVAVDSEWNMYVWDVQRARWKPDEILEKIFYIQRIYQPRRVGMETVAFQRMLVWGFDEKARREDSWFYIEPLKTDNTVSKQMRIRGFEPFVSNQKLFLRLSAGSCLTRSFTDSYHALSEGQDVLVDEMSRFPLGGTDDVIDALAYQPQLIFPVGTAPEPQPHPQSFDALWRNLRKRRSGNARTLSLKP